MEKDQTNVLPSARVAGDEAEQEVLFCIEGPDEDGCVWICSAKGRDVWCQNLGPTTKVAAVLTQWLSEHDEDLGASESERIASSSECTEAQERPGPSAVSHAFGAKQSGNVVGSSRE